MIIKFSKWFAPTVTTGAALVSILNYLHNHGYLGGSEAELLAATASRISVSPASDTATAIGDTLQLSATVIDRRGTTISGASASWSSDDPEIASVDSAGAVVARAPGSTWVVIAVHKHVARSHIVVAPRATGIRFAVEQPFYLPEGEQRHVVARGIDRRGAPVINGVRWRSADTAIAAVDSNGTVTGMVPGRATLVATVEGVTDSLTARVDPVPSALVVISGGEQRVAAGRSLPEPVVVEVLSRGRRPIPRHPVRFVSLDGQGESGRGSDTTDARGHARMPWTLTGVPGRQRLLVSAEGLDSSVTVLAEADPVAANSRVFVDSTLSGPASGLVPQPVVIKVTDSIGRALADVPVAWAVMDGGGIQGNSTRTDSLGEASARWTLGTRTGAQRARIQLGSGRTVPPFTVTARALPGPPAQVTAVSGIGQQGIAGSPLGKPLVLRVVDSSGNAVSGVPLALAPKAGTLADSAATTDSSGRAVIHWVLGRGAGRQTMTVRAAGVGAPLEVTAVARSLKPANIAFLGSPIRGVVGQVMRGQVSVRVTDVYGNPVPDASVSFTVAMGRVAPARVMTDDKGDAATQWTLGSGAGDQSLTASVKGTEARSTLTLTATAVAAARTSPKR